MAVNILHGRKVAEDDPEWIAFCKRTDGNGKEMLETQTPPGAWTDRDFFKGKGTDQCRDNEMTEEDFAEYKAVANAAGVSTEGKTYIGSLARKVKDPEAWCSDFDDAKALARKRGDVDLFRGGIKVVSAKEPENPPDEEPYAVADNVVNRMADEAIAMNPDIEHDIPREDLLDTIRENCTPEGID